MPVIVQGNARALQLPDESVDLIVTSPPYWSLRAYQDGGTAYDGQIGEEASPQEFIAALLDCTREMVRVLKPFGSIFLNLGDKYAGSPSGPQGKSGARVDRQQAASFAEARGRQRGNRQSVPNKSLMLLPERFRIACVDELGLIARAVIVWDKPNGLPSSVTDRVNRTHEDWVHLTRSPKYFAAVDEIREPTQGRADQMTWEQRKARGDALRQGEQRGTFGGGGMAQNPLGKLPGSVWEIATQPLKVPVELGIDHHAAFPMAWPLRLIKGWSPPDGVVLDPFSGTGTTALVATMLGRTGIGIDLSADYCRLAGWRASDPKERARAAGLDPDVVAKVVPSIPGQTELFGEAS